jgi:nucleoside-diphosphate-sugar epimerase
MGSSMRILIIGGTRFIGPRLVHCLVTQGHEVAVFHRGRTTTAPPVGVCSVVGDRHRLADYAEDFRRFGPDVVVDMILFTEEDARSSLATFRSIAGRFVAISSGDVYRAYGVFSRLEFGPLEPTPLNEDSSLRQVLFPYRTTVEPGSEHYDYEKILVERAVRTDPKLPATILRLPMVYGPGDYQHRLAPYLKRMLDGRRVILLDEGMARWRCLRGYVDDVAAAVALAVTNPAASGRVYNVAEPTAYTEAEWVSRIGAVVGWTGQIVSVPGGKVPVLFSTAQDLRMDTSRIRAELGYREVTDPNDALRLTVAWERDHLPELSLDYDQEDRLLTELQV